MTDDRTSTRAISRERHPRDDAERPSRERRSRDDAERPSRERRPRDEAEREKRTGHRDEDEGRERPQPRGRSDGIGAARTAAEHVLQLTGRSPENVVSVVRDEEGWQVGVEVMELHRIPETTDIMAVYEVALDTNGDLVRCERGHRYHRGQLEEELW